MKDVPIPYIAKRNIRGNHRKRARDGNRASDHLTASSGNSASVNESPNEILNDENSAREDTNMANDKINGSDGNMPIDGNSATEDNKGREEKSTNHNSIAKGTCNAKGESQGASEVMEESEDEDGEGLAVIPYEPDRSTCELGLSLPPKTDEQAREQSCVNKRIGQLEVQASSLAGEIYVANPSHSSPTRDERISNKWERHSVRARGLKNQGNRCYQLAVLQALFHVPTFVNWIERRHLHRLGVVNDLCTMCIFRMICIRYWGLPGHPLTGPDLALFENALGRTDTFRNDGWIFSQQNDAYLFLLQLLAAFPENYPCLTYMTNSLLGHSTVTKRTCNHCKHESEQHTFFQQERILQIGWDTETSLDEIFAEQEFRHEAYDVLKCEICNVKGRHPYSRRLQKTPDVLIIQLKRFKADGEGNDLRKKTDTIALTEFLDLTDSMVNRSPVYYTLQAVVHHQGSLNFGHYIADAKGPDGLWDRINDDQVSTSTIEEALDPSSLDCEDYKPWTPYLLFYIRTTSQEARKVRRPDTTTSSGTSSGTSSVKSEESEPMKFNRPIKSSSCVPSGASSEMASSEISSVGSEESVSITVNPPARVSSATSPGTSSGIPSVRSEEPVPLRVESVPLRVESVPLRVNPPRAAKKRRINPPTTSKKAVGYRPGMKKPPWKEWAGKK